MYKNTKKIIHESLKHNYVYSIKSNASVKLISSMFTDVYGNLVINYKFCRYYNISVKSKLRKHKKFIPTIFNHSCKSVCVSVETCKYYNYSNN